MRINDDKLIIRGKVVKIIQFKEEWDVDIDDPEQVIDTLKTYNEKADIFTFVQRLPESKPKYSYYMEWESVAAIPIISYEHWLTRQISHNSKKKIGLAKRKGVEIKICDFNDEFVYQLLGIYKETPVRQLVPNTKYNFDFEAAKKDNEEYLDRSVFLGAYLGKELIGFLKIVDAGKYTRTMGIIGKVAHRDKAPMNLLVDKAVELCAQRRTSYLTYGKYDFGNVGVQSLKDFKKNLGFENIIHPRYFIPLTFWGRLIIKIRFHRGVKQLLPRNLVRFLLFIRRKWYEKKFAQYLNRTKS